MVNKEYILKILDRVEEIKPSEFVKWASFKSFGLPKIREYITGEIIERKEREIDIVKEAERIMGE